MPFEPGTANMISTPSFSSPRMKRSDAFIGVPRIAPGLWNLTILQIWHVSSLYTAALKSSMLGIWTSFKNSREGGERGGGVIVIDGNDPRHNLHRN